MLFVESYRRLVETITKKETDKIEAQETIEFLDERVEKFSRYIQAVNSHLTGSNSALIMMKGGLLSVESYQERIKTLDTDRRLSHEVAIAAVDQINRICDIYGVEHICPDDPDRHVRANFAAAVTMECFMLDHGKSREEIEQMYALVDYDPTEKNVDLVVDLMQKGAKLGKEFNVGD